MVVKALSILFDSIAIGMYYAGTEALYSSIFLFVSVIDLILIIYFQETPIIFHIFDSVLGMFTCGFQREKQFVFIF